MDILPLKIKSEICCYYLFNDFLCQYKRFFSFCELKTGNIDELMFYDITQGLLPRRFQCIDEDMIIVEESQEVDELYFIMGGFIGIGFMVMGNMKSNITMQ